MALEAGSKYANHWRDLMTQFKKSGENSGYEDLDKFFEKMREFCDGSLDLGVYASKFL